MSTLDDEEHLILTAPCVRCDNLFMSNPFTVPSTAVHPATRCPTRPDGSRVKAADPDAVCEPLCPSCAALFQAAGGEDRPMSELFPHARLDLIDIAAALAAQGGGE